MYRWSIVATTVVCVTLVAGCFPTADGKGGLTLTVPGTITPSPTITVEGVIHVASPHGVACFTLTAGSETWGILSPPGTYADSSNRYLPEYGPGKGLSEGVAIGLKGEEFDDDASLQSWNNLCPPVDSLFAFSGQTE